MTVTYPSPRAFPLKHFLLFKIIKKKILLAFPTWTTNDHKFSPQQMVQIARLFNSVTSTLFAVWQWLDTNRERQFLHQSAKPHTLIVTVHRSQNVAAGIASPLYDLFECSLLSFSQRYQEAPHREVEKSHSAAIVRFPRTSQQRFSIAMPLPFPNFTHVKNCSSCINLAKSDIGFDVMKWAQAINVDRTWFYMKTADNVGFMPLPAWVLLEQRANRATPMVAFFLLHEKRHKSRTNTVAAKTLFVRRFISLFMPEFITVRCRQGQSESMVFQ